VILITSNIAILRKGCCGSIIAWLLITPRTNWGLTSDPYQQTFFAIRNAVGRPRILSQDLFLSSSGVYWATALLLLPSFVRHRERRVDSLHLVRSLSTASSNHSFFLPVIGPRETLQTWLQSSPKLGSMPLMTIAQLRLPVLPLRRNFQLCWGSNVTRILLVTASPLFVLYILLILNSLSDYHCPCPPLVPIHSTEI
jgi:hypothetical protein